MIKARIIPRPKLAAKIVTRFPARVLGGTGIAIDKTGGVYTFSQDISDIIELSSISASDRDNLLFAIWNEDTDAWRIVSLDTVLTSLSAGLDPTLVSIAALNPTTDQAIYFTASETAATYSLTASGRALAGVTGAADKLAYFTNASTATTTDLTAFWRTVLAATTAAASNTLLGLGTGDSPQFTAVNIGHATNTTITQAAPGLIAVEGDTVALLTASQALTNKTLTAPDINAGTADSLTSLSVRSTGSAFDLLLASSAVYSANRTLTFNIADGNTTVTFTGSVGITSAASGVGQWSGGTLTGTNNPVLGAAGTASSVTFSNATSGTIQLQPVTGALGTVTVSIPAATDTLVNLSGTQELDNKTLDSSVAKGTWTASGTWTIPAVTLNGTVTLNGKTLSGAATFDNAVSGVTTFTLSSYIDLTEIASPSSPASDHLRLFPKDVAGATHLFSRDSAGTEVDMTLGGSGAAAATQAEEEAASSTSVYASPGRQHFHPGHPKCWAFVTYSAGTPTLTSNYNITSITDTGVGLLTVTIATDFSSANWAALLNVRADSTTTPATRYASHAAGSILLVVLDGPSTVDPESFSFMGLGDQ